LVVVVRRGLAFGDFGSDDLLYFGLGEGMSFRLRGAEAGYGASKRGPPVPGAGVDSTGTALALSIADRAVRSADTAIVSRARSASRRAS
jgi:hypothetical protein